MLLDAVTGWCLDHLPDDPPHLVGVSLNSRSVSFSILELLADDPLADLNSLAAPDHWDLAVIVCSSSKLKQSDGRVRLAHAMAREGATFTEIRSTSGPSISMRNAVGAIATACAELFEAQGPSPHPKLVPGKRRLVRHGKRSTHS